MADILQTAFSNAITEKFLFVLIQIPREFVPKGSIERVDSRLVPSQWKTSLQSNAVSHWLGANLESALNWHAVITDPMRVRCQAITMNRWRPNSLTQICCDHDDVIKWKHFPRHCPFINAGDAPVTGDFLAQRPVTRSFDVFFDLHLNKRLSKQSWCWWFDEMS